MPEMSRFSPKDVKIRKLGTNSPKVGTLIINYENICRRSRKKLPVSCRASRSLLSLAV